MVTDSEGLLAELEESGALRHGHYQLSSGLHSNRYVQCAKLLEDPVRARRAGVALAAQLEVFDPVSVLSPALGGLIIGHETAEALGVPFRFCERKDDAMCLRRGFELAEHERVVVIEDVVTTGGSAREAALVARESGALVVAYGAIIDRSSGSSASGGSGGSAGSDGSVPFDAPLVSLLELEVVAWAASECPSCAAGEPLTAPGSRRVNSLI